MGKPTFLLERAARQTLGAEVARVLRQAILAGEYRPGDHITEAEIAQQMGVSHGPVREGLRELESEDLLVIEPHRGAFVKSFSARDVREAYELRAVLESAAVRSAVRRLTARHLRDLETVVQRMRQAQQAGNVTEVIDLDLDFHRRLCLLADNRRIYEAWQRLTAPIRLFLSLAVPDYLSLEEEVESHPPIIEALRRGDVDAATTHMEHGVLTLGEQLMETLLAARQAVAS